MTTLTPPDLTKCQTEITVGNSLAIGNPRRTQQCGKPPVTIAIEKRPGSDGQIGSMSMCEGCKAEFIRQYGTDVAHFTDLP